MVMRLASIAIASMLAAAACMGAPPSRPASDPIALSGAAARADVAAAVIAAAPAIPRPTPRPTATAKPTPRPTATPKATPTPTPRPTATPKAKATPTLTPTPKPTPTPTPMPTSPPTGPDRYVIGTVNVTDIWVDPVHGSDADSGSSRSQALRTVAAAWGRIPASTTLGKGFRLQLVAGTYPAADLPSYWEHRWGTRQNPVILNAVDGPHTATLRGDLNVFDARYLYVIGVDIAPGGDAFHCERCSYVLLRFMALSGAGAAQETIKVNQSDHLYIEDSDIAGAYENAIDFVAVQYGHIRGNRIHAAEDWCAYVKGGSAYLIVSENEIYDCGTGGFTAGQGTGFEFMTSPWLHYEAYGISITNNVIHDTEGAGLGVNGGYDILLAYNTLYRVGSRSHAVEFVHGARSCDGATAACAQRRAAGGWGTTAGGAQYIPDRHVYFYDNVVYNPAGSRTAWSHFAVAGSVTPPADSGVAGPSQADADLRIVGNIIWNGDASMDLGVGGDAGCADTNPTCNAAQLRADNAINTVEPELQDPAHGDFRPVLGGTVATRPGAPIPSFSWSDVPATPAVPAGATDNHVPRNRAGEPRAGWGVPGAY